VGDTATATATAYVTNGKFTPASSGGHRAVLKSGSDTGGKMHTATLILAWWLAVSVLSVPLLVLLLRVLGAVNARVTRRLDGEAWTESTRHANEVLDSTREVPRERRRRRRPSPGLPHGIL
jgi:hypothetical protein